MPSPVLGIDLGTTNSVVACADEQRVRVLRDEQGHLITPSTVSFLQAAEALVGYPARDRRLIDVANTVFSVKRLIGRPYRSPEVRRAAERLPFKLEEGPTGGVVVRVQGETFSLPEIASFILRRLRQIAEQALGQPCLNAVITVPANFNELQRMATRDAGRIAGLNVLRILNEPTAAALAYGYRARQQQRIAVYDFGGGTFDISILELSGDVIEVVATAGDSNLGGDDLDRAVADRMVAVFQAAHGLDLRRSPQQYERVVMAAEWLKCQLSELELAEATIKELAFAGGKPLDLKFRLSRSELQALSEPLIARTFGICEDAFRAAGVRPTQLDGVILVGGQTRTPKVREMVAEYFGMEPQSSVDPDLAVAQGAALQGYALAGVPAAELAQKAARTLMGPGPATQPPPADDPFQDEPTRVAEPKDTEPPTPVSRRSDTPFDDLPTTITLRDPDFEPTKVGEVRVQVPSIRPEGALGTHASTLAGVGAQLTAAEAAAAIAAAKPAAVPSSPPAKSAPPVRAPLRAASLPPAARAASLPPPPPPPRAAARSAPLEAADEPELPAVLRSLDADDELGPVATVQERPSAKRAVAQVQPPQPSAAGANEAAASATEEPIRTHSMARLLAAQGHLARALAIYTELLERTPSDPQLSSEAAALRAKLAGVAAPPVNEEVRADAAMAREAVLPPAPVTPPMAAVEPPAVERSPEPDFAEALPAVTTGVSTRNPTPIPAPRPPKYSQFPAPPSVAPLLLDVTPHTLSVETVGGFCEQIIERNAPIPTEQTRVFTTSRDNQDTVSVRVCQGESRRTDENQVLGQIDLLGLRPARRGEVSIAVTFVLDADGTLSVRAVDEGTGRGQEIRVSLVGAIEDQDLERMQARQRRVAR